MAPTQALKLRIEQLRRQLHEGMTASYDPQRLQALTPISEELDRLVVRCTREELSPVKRPTGTDREG